MQGQGPGLGQQEGMGLASHLATVGQNPAPLSHRRSGRDAAQPRRVSSPGQRAHLAGCSRRTPSCASPVWCCCAALSPPSHPSCCRCPSSQRPGQPTTACCLGGEGRNMQQLSPSPPAPAVKSSGSTQIYMRWPGKRGLSSAFGGEASPPQLLEVATSSLCLGRARRKGKGFTNCPHHPASSHP